MMFNYLRANFYKLCTYALLILAISGAGATWWFYDSAKDAKKDLAVARADTRVAIEQRDKAKYIAEQVIAFNQSFQNTTDILRNQLRSCQAGVRKAKQDNENAVNRWIAEAKDADAAQEDYMARVNAKPKTCGAALAELDRVCESLAGY